MSMHHALLFNDISQLPEISDGNVDVWRLQVDILGIDAVRELKQQAYQRAVSVGGQRTIVVETLRIRSEAQNALLKILEEPPALTVMYFVVADQSRLLPTLLSRFSREQTAAQDISTAVSEEFLTLSPAEQLTLVAKKTSEKDLLWQRALLDGLEVLILEKRVSKTVARALYFVRQHITAPGASPKLLLEHLTLSLAELK